MLEHIQQLEDPQSSLSRIWDEQHDRQILSHLLQSSQSSFSPVTWQAFRRVALEGARPADVAAELGLTVNAVLIAKSRVLAHVKRLAKGLVES